MKLIIDIPKIHYEYFKHPSTQKNFLKISGKTIGKGIPLAKHDAEVIKETVASVWGEPPYIELLDKIRVELHATAEMHEDNVYYLREEWIDEIINKYKWGIRNENKRNHYR